MRTAYRVTRWFRNRIAVPLRKFFGFGDKVARVLMIAISVGGTALVVKKVFGLNLLPDEYDFIVKRGGAILTGITVALYLAMVVSKLSFELSQVCYDESTMGNELCFYVSIVVFCISFALFNSGNPLWDILGSSDPNHHIGPLPWGETTLRLSFCLVVISTIWSICFGLNVISRLFEHYRRERLGKD
jgi:hypothetical protein